MTNAIVSTPHLRLVSSTAPPPQTGAGSLECVCTLRLKGVRAGPGEDVVPSAWRDLLALLWSSSAGSGEVVELIHEFRRTPAGQPQRYEQWIRLMQRDNARASATVSALPLAIRSSLPRLVHEPAPESDPGSDGWVPRAVLRPAPVALLTPQRRAAPFVRGTWAFPTSLPNWKMTVPLDEALCDALRIHCRFTAAQLSEDERRGAVEYLHLLGTGHAWVLQPDAPPVQSSHHPGLASLLLDRLQAWIKGQERGFRFEAVLCTPEHSELEPYVARRVAFDLFGHYPWTLTPVEDGYMSRGESLGLPLLNEQGLPGAFVASSLLVSKFGVTELSDAPAKLPKGPGAMVGHVGGEPLVLPHADLASHTLVVGGSGTGKSSTLLRILQQDMAQGLGVGLLDPHGDTADRLLELVPPGRRRDVVWVDVDDATKGAAINPMEGTLERPLLRAFVAGQLLHLIKNNGENHDAWGPATENHLRQCFLLAMNHPSGGTIYDAARLLEDNDFCDWLLSKTQDESLISHFKIWRGTRGEQGYDSWRPWLLARLHPFTKSMPLVRMLQRPSTLDLEDVINRSRIIVFRLGKATLSEVECQLLGTALLLEFQRAAVARARRPVGDRPPFRLVVDEFQTFASDATPNLFREARKYNLGIVAATQSLTSLVKPHVSSLKDAVLANTATKIIHRVSPVDANTLDDYTTPHFLRADLMRTRNYEAVVCMSAGDIPPMRVQLSPPDEPLSADSRFLSNDEATKSNHSLADVDAYLAKRHGIRV